MESSAADPTRAAVGTPATPRAGHVSRFFPWMAAVLLGVNLVGFGPTFFLRPLFGGSELPLRTHLHGFLFTSWFVLLLGQAVLATRGRMATHRLLGLMGAGLAAAMVVSGLVTLYFGVGSFLERGGTVPRASQFFWGNIMLLVSFVSFVALGFRNRHRRDAHMRLMLLASLSMISQSIARISEFRVFESAGVDELGSALFTLGGLVGLLACLPVHDLIVRKRIHPVSGWGVPALMLAFLAGVFLIPALPPGQALIRLLY
jgi:hypothetical protein